MDSCELLLLLLLLLSGMSVTLPAAVVVLSGAPVAALLLLLLLLLQLLRWPFIMSNSNGSESSAWATVSPLWTSNGAAASSQQHKETPAVAHDKSTTSHEQAERRVIPKFCYKFILKVAACHF